MGKKNSQIHLVMETKLLNELKRKASEKGLSTSEFCRQKLRDDTQLDRIEKIIKRNFN